MSVKQYVTSYEMIPAENVHPDYRNTTFVRYIDYEALERRVAELEQMVEDGPVPPACSAEDFARAVLEVDALTRGRDELLQHVCDECCDKTGAPTGWVENRVEGRVPCACVSESEPYQILQRERDELRKEVDRLTRAAIKAFVDNNPGTDSEEIADVLGITIGTASDVCRELLNEGELDFADGGAA